jgi:hypothetical protein
VLPEKISTKPNRSVVAAYFDPLAAEMNYKMKQDHQDRKIKPIFRIAAGFISALGIPTAILMIYTSQAFLGIIGVLFNLYIFFFVSVK